MDKKEIRRALQQIAAERVSSQLDLWPAMQKQLQKQARPFGRQWLPRLGTAMVTVLLLLFFLVWLNSLAQLRQMEDMTAVSLPISEPPDIGLGLTLPAAPAALPRYQVIPILPPDNPEEILTWAEDFGFATPRLFRDPRSWQQQLILDGDDSRLIFPGFVGIREIGYLRDGWLDLPLGEAASVEAATAAAISFLAEHNQLPEKHHVRNILVPFFNSDGYPLRTIRVSPDLDGYPLQGAYGAGPGAVVQVDAAGEVFAAGFTEAGFVALEMMAIRPAEAVVEDFVNGRITPLHTDQMAPVGEMTTVKQYTPPLPQHDIGESVTVLETDDTHFLLAQDGGEHQVILRTAVGTKYELLTPDLAQIADTIGDASLQVSGTIVGQTAPDTWQLSVASWEKILPQQLFLSGCALGLVEIGEDGSAWITAEAVLGRLEVNGRYHIPNLPTDISHGDRIEVCSEPMLTLAEAIPWSAIFVPPRTWHYDGQTAEVEVSVQSASPYEPGDTVTLTGLVAATIHQEDDVETLKVTLWADLADGNSSHLYALVGDEALLAALASEQLHHYVQITGTIVLADDTPWGDQAIEVQAFAQPWPEQQVEVYVGRLSQERSDDSVITLFTDEADGQSYALPENGPRFEGTLLDAGQVWVAGIVHPTYQVNGRPALRLLQWFPAQPGEIVTIESYTLTSEPRLVQSERLPESLERADLVIDHIELAYFFAPPDKPDTAEPVWVVYGHWRDNQELFVAFLDAVVR